MEYNSTETPTGKFNTGVENIGSIFKTVGQFFPFGFLFIFLLGGKVHYAFLFIALVWGFAFLARMLNSLITEEQPKRKQRRRYKW